jgi:hypothetical protein
VKRWLAALAGLVALVFFAPAAEGDATGGEPTPVRLEGPARAWDGDTLEVTRRGLMTVALP